MQRKLFFFVLGLVLWSVFGALIGRLSAVILSYTWVIQATASGAAIGLLTGCIVGLVGLSISSRFRSNAVMLWLLAGSLIGAGTGFQSTVAFGKYPNGSQADLSFIVLGPVGLAIGTLVGTLAGVLIWKLVQSRAVRKS